MSSPTTWAETPHEVQEALLKQYGHRTPRAEKQVEEMSQPKIKLGVNYLVTSTSQVETITGFSKTHVVVATSYDSDPRVYKRADFEDLIKRGARVIIHDESAAADDLDAVWAASNSGARGLVSLEEVVRGLRADRDAMQAERDMLRAALVALKKRMLDSIDEVVTVALEYKDNE